MVFIFDFNRLNFFDKTRSSESLNFYNNYLYGCLRIYFDYNYFDYFLEDFSSFEALTQHVSALG